MMELQDLAFVVPTCSELHDVVMNLSAIERHFLYQQSIVNSLPSQAFFFAFPKYH